MINHVPPKAYRVFSKSLVVMALCVIMYGAYTRLVDAGLGCPDWPGCYGFFSVPEQLSEVAIANERFPQTPVEAEKAWPEMVHRYLASTLGLAVLVFCIWTIRLRKAGVQVPVGVAIFMTGFVVLQGMFGMWTVTLKLWPQVVTSHLMGGMGMISMLFWCAISISRFSKTTEQVRSIPAHNSVADHSPRKWALVGVLLVAVQIMLGGWMSSNYSALACPDFPTCQGVWWPEMDFQEGFDLAQDIGPNYLGGKMDNPGRVAIHMTHRLGAVLVLLFTAVFFVRFKSWWKQHARFWAIAMMSLLSVQIALGVTNVLASLPLHVAVSHNAVGALLLLAWVAMLRIASYSAEAAERVSSKRHTLSADTVSAV